LLTYFILQLESHDISVAHYNIIIIPAFLVGA